MVRPAYDEEVFERVLAPLGVPREYEAWVLAMPDGSTGELHPDLASGSISMNRPPGNMAFFDCVLDLLRRTPSVVYWPGGGCCVADAAVIPHLPESFIESCGVPAVVASGAEIVTCIKRS